MNDTTSNIETAQASANEAARAAEAAAADTRTTEDELRSANERANAAAQRAEDIATAAIESERGHRIEQLQREHDQWRSEHQNRMTILEQRLSEMEARQASPTTPALSIHPTSPIQPQMPAPELNQTERVTVEATRTVEPASENQGAQEAAAIAAQPRKRFRLT